MRTIVVTAALSLSCGASEWVRHTAGAPLPETAVVVSGADSPKRAICRARLADGNLHPGVSTGACCESPQKGKAERALDFEIAVNGSARWTAGDWDAGLVAGRQGRSDLYLCRAPVRVGDTQAGWAFGKAYRAGPHAQHCYAVFDEREIDVPSGYEILGVESGPPKMLPGRR